MSYAKKARLFFGLALAAAVATALACGGDKEVPVEVIKEVQVPVEVVVEKEVVKVVEVPVEKIVEVEKEVVVEVEKVEIVEVVKEVAVEVEKEVVVEVVKVVQVVVEYPIPGSELTVTVSDVGPQTSYKRSITAEPMIMYPSLMGVTEKLLDYHGDTLTLSPMIARSWTLDETGVAFTIRNDVPWEDSKYGFVTAEDVHGSYEESAKTLNGWISEFYIPHWENQRVEGDKVIWDWAAGQTLTWSKPARHAWQGVDVESMAYLAAMGEAFVHENAMGTGPYRVIEHKSDDLITLEGVKDHWRIQPGFETVTLLEVLEQTTRIAMLLSGDSDGTLVGLPFLDQVDEPGITLHSTKQATGSGVSIYMGGNYRIRTDVVTGEAAPSVYRGEDPWVGELDDPVSMENARKVRQAMSVAIDRELLRDQILGGLGCLSYNYGYTSCDAHYQPEWEDPYDPELAMQLLAEAGHPDGFEFTVWIPEDSPETQSEMQIAIFHMWEDIGLKPTIDGRSTDVRMDDLAHNRSMNDVWISPWGGSCNVLECWAQEMGAWNATIEWNWGIDFPEAYDIANRFTMEFDPDKGWDIAKEFIGFIHDDYLAFGTVTFDEPFAIGPRVGEVDMDMKWNSIPELESWKPALQ